MRKCFFSLLLFAVPAAAANLDGALDSSYGNAGRSVLEFTQSTTPQLQATDAVRSTHRILRSRLGPSRMR